MIDNPPPPRQVITEARAGRAAAIARAGGLQTARDQGLIPRRVDLTLSEALVLGLLQQEVRIYFAVFGHGSTELGEVLRIYQEAGLVRVLAVRSEIEASHAAAALRWVRDEKAAVVTSIGPGALQAMAASLVPASDGLGVWYLCGDETTEDEGFKMQQIPRHEQGLFLRLASTLGAAYTLHTPLALPTALQRGAAAVDHPTRPAPFYLLLPMNTQASWMPAFNLDELPSPCRATLGPAVDGLPQAAEWIRSARKPLVKVGGGARWAGQELQEFLELTGAVLVHTPIAAGCIPSSHPRNMGVGGSKGSLSGNFAMEHADLLIAIGTRAVCQSDCSRTGYPAVQRIINLNADLNDALHYNRTLPLIGDLRRTLQDLNQMLQAGPHPANAEWLRDCAGKKAEWEAFKAARMNAPGLKDDYWGDYVLTQPAAIHIALEWAKSRDAIAFFDAGDVQANGFQIADVERPDQVFTESGASYMGFAASALLGTAAASKPFYGLALTGDGSFTMNPQILIDGVEHGAQGCILILDNGRMGAISGLQRDQYGVDFATRNTIHVDYLIWGRAVPGVLAVDGGRTPDSLRAALEQAGKHPGLSLVHLPVYYGLDELGGMGVFGRWNVGSWCTETQALRHDIGL
jgi:3D-(3,5/4)-trihydroxycyclohexane-1,2-dione acylhydrolase (decyclizing)